MVISRRDAALALDIPMEMAQRHGIPSRLTEAELAELQNNPPQWLLQSRANRTGKRPVWVHLSCAVCGYSEAIRPKKWWPDFSFVFCGHHRNSELPELYAGQVRSEFDGIGSRFIGVVDVDAKQG
ncbi:hypothetical protein [Arthrobacter sp. CJ23]|uniref:hypothetical protein n=1 Tax=Arthrobacter sp. CJ23 TaxID=2972479 RepID=UPI00215BC5CD|nr:hypothetical protein [Arthrobacter sp. CJ23]UVJ38284.1 hypothetical protein NVV90_13640 [Arthrobacter sp. CJ23]